MALFPNRLPGEELKNRSLEAVQASPRALESLQRTRKEDLIMAIPARGRAPFLLVSLALAGLPAMAQTYTVVDLGTLGGSGSQAYGINGAGQIVGDATTGSGSSHAFLYEGGRMSDLNTGGTLSAARAINDSGQVAGYYDSRGYQAFLETSFKVHDLGNLGGNYSVAYAVNAQGHVCGSSYT